MLSTGSIGEHQQWHQPATVKHWRW